ncbi:hypothetical protein Kpol_218p4 [Vanderwaltozyma polyspora DSM 70294]|uniref:Importin N-terminal domain-containing protein n=1 Tax=Vanderwaltozyma polyspora (strain ATCC 22028 / DSM 70294 / BCRC 21397 / CBS 2163 / NBRC 10782 / NRRL Y-8283 / UCD 57-17) TaxID=436907 RepID=A7TTJ0_VANPO|nr:uncharacterized protein Kpol_218p4 [Vanderwaltozyma polyspora DSM 70294]EDO14419.1 hypothetical protein Kpol_218p4 [Vanderwaltozyma polyspora DSM 70294]
MSYNIENLKTALDCISSNISQDKKNEALRYLEQFQKSNESWSICHEILVANGQYPLSVDIFASQTLRNKVTYDLSQLGSDNLSQFKDSLLYLISIHSHKLIITQLNVALARLTIQHLQWINPLPEIIEFLNPFPSKLLEFLKILPEETLDIGSTPLTENEFNSRTHELIESIREDVLKFLVTCIEMLKNRQQLSQASNISLEQVLRCLSSWSFEFSVDQLISIQPLTSAIFESLMNGNEDDSTGIFDAAVDCLTVIIRESRDSTPQLVNSLCEQLLLLQGKLLPTLLNPTTSGEDLDDDLMEGMTRLFVEAGEAWVIFISKSPQQFEKLVIALLMFTSKNSDLDVVEYTFPFWFNLKLNLVLPRYQESRKIYIPIYVELIRCIIRHLRYPSVEFSSKENEDKFKDFRYHMGDVLKDCTAVVGASKALAQPLEIIQETLANSNEWQSLEAPLFSLRTMAQEISSTENTLLPQIFNILINLPEHPKIRYASTLVLGRYTEWTAKHPDMLQVQLQYIFKGFEVAGSNREILTASSHALMYFCADCSEFLVDYIEQLFDFYLKIKNIVDIESQFELYQGFSAVLNKQPSDKVLALSQQLLSYDLNEISELVPKWQTNRDSFSAKIADKIDLIFAMFEELKPRFEYPDQGSEPLAPLIVSLWDFLKHILIDLKGLTDNIIVERTTKLLRRLFEKFHIFCEPILSSVVEFLVDGYSNTGFGSYLWCSASLIVVFGDDESLPISPQLKSEIWRFGCAQSLTFIMSFASLDHSNINDYYEQIMDFFAMVSDLIMFYPKEFILSTDLLGNVVDIAIASVHKLENYDAYTFIIRCLDDIISWGFRTPPISTISIESVPDEWRQQILQEIVIGRGAAIVTSLFSGLVTNFNETTHSDAISCIVKLFRLATEANNNEPSICRQWVIEAVNYLGHTTSKERDDLCNSVVSGLNKRDFRKIREGIRLFVNWYLRKNVESRYQ